MKAKPIYLYVTPFFPTPTSWRGGYCLDAAKALVRTGRYDVRVFVTGKGEDYTICGIRVHRLPVVHIPCGLLPFIRAFFMRIAFARVLKRCGISLNDVGVCHLHTMGLAPLSKWVKKNNEKVLTLVHHHCCFPIGVGCGRLGVVPLHADLEYLWIVHNLRWVDAHVFVSEKSKQSFGKFFGLEPEGEWQDIRDQLIFGRFYKPVGYKQAIVAYNGIDTNVFSPGWREDCREFVIGCVGNFQPLKGQMTLLQAFKKVIAEVPQARLVFIGSGECLSACQEYASRNFKDGIVRFEKEVEHLKLPEFYRSLDLFVLPSRLEGFCCVYVEAIGCGIPVMGCRGISIEEVMPEEDKDKWLATPNSPDDLASKILSFHQRRSSFKLVRSLDIDAIAREFLSAVDGLKPA